MRWPRRSGEFPWIEMLVIGLLAGATRSPALIVIAAAGIAAWILVEVTGRLALVGVEARASLSRDRLVAGESTLLVLEVVNRKPLPLPWLEVRVELPEGIEPDPAPVGVSRQHVAAGFAPRGHERVTLRFPLRAERRGAYVLGPVRLRGGDWLGFVQEERRVPLDRMLVAHPAPVGVADRHLAALRPLAEASNRRGLVPDPLRFRGIREYRGGDPRKEIHWKASARLRSLQTKLYEPATSLDAIFLVNVASYDKYWIQVDPEGTEVVISAAAELVRMAAEAGRQIGLITNGLDNITHERPRSAMARGPRSLTRALDILARLGPYAGASPEAAFIRERGRLPTGATCVAVTPNISPKLANTLVSLRRAHHRVLAVSNALPAPAVVARLHASDVPLVTLGYTEHRVAV
ncbi:MAG TPA: DUF58 domain-containing protein [Candidatus Limnocylindrales bacterium]|nr:DUF58 domain-containing protein [Candidatus Limnocylindrales bacterium]